MSDDKRRLGRSLDSLISAARGRELSVDLIRHAGHRIQAVPVEGIEPNPFQPRRDFPVEALNELVESLRTHGLMQPIVVRKKEPRLQIVAGERRWRASRELGWDTIDAVVIEADDRRMLEWALVENIQRESLGPLELAQAFRQLARDFGLTQEEVARAVGMSRPAVANLIRLLDLPIAVQERVSRGTVSMGAARAILALTDASAQEELARRVEDSGLNVRQVERLVRLQARPSSSSKTGEPDPHQKALEAELQEELGTRVRLSGSLKRGRLILHFHSGRELDRLIRRLRGEAPSFAPPQEEDGFTV